MWYAWCFGLEAPGRRVGAITAGEAIRAADADLAAEVERVRRAPSAMSGRGAAELFAKRVGGGLADSAGESDIAGWREAHAECEVRARFLAALDSASAHLATARRDSLDDIVRTLAGERNALEDLVGFLLEADGSVVSE
jgi:hypothetical protein